MNSSSHKCGPCGLKTGWGPALLATAHRGAVHVNVIQGELAQHKFCGPHPHLKEGFAALLKSHEKQIEALEKGFGFGLFGNCTVALWMITRITRSFISFWVSDRLWWGLESRSQSPQGAMLRSGGCYEIYDGDCQRNVEIY